MIKVQELIYDYPGTRALDKISLEIQEATITALVGPNGAGKTTLLKCISGLEKPFSGYITVDGIDVIRNPRDCHKVIAFLPDFFGLYESLTVRQVLMFFAAAAGLKNEAILEAVYRTAELLWLTKLLDTGIKELSRGMKQRVAIAQAVVKQPKILLLDEPASGLDPGARNELSSVFKQLKAEGMTLIVSSHILAELEEYADSLMIINKGQVVKAGENIEKESITVSISTIDSSEKLNQIVKATEYVENVKEYDSNLIVELSGGKEQAADLLKTAIRENCEIYNYQIIEKDMQSEYMKAIKLEKGENNHE
ncbi:MAG: ABC transporter ATP-binding protein [Kiritimatiellae bacterium]|jgi:ABC-2 type transport system ATP-binding protein|nr:ABC transporter ATP-binding protein [Kiritimatiellia bacterium]